MSLQDILKMVPPPKVLSIRDLEDLDDADLKAVIEAEIPVKSDHE